MYVLIVFTMACGFYKCDRPTIPAMQEFSSETTCLQARELIFSYGVNSRCVPK